MNRESLKGIVESAVGIGVKEQRKFILRKIANAQGPDDQEENGVWCDFYERFQDMIKVTYGVEIPDLTQDDVERLKT